jgi:hypothetical protein
VSATYSKKSLEEILREAVNTPRCVCGCGRYSAENTFSSPECFNREEEEVIY